MVFFNEESSISVWPTSEASASVSAFDPDDRQNSGGGDLAEIRKTVLHSRTQVIWKTIWNMISTKFKDGTWNYYLQCQYRQLRGCIVVNAQKA